MALEDGQVGKLDVEITTDNNKYAVELKTAKQITKDFAEGATTTLETAASKVKKSFDKAGKSAKDYGEILGKDIVNKLPQTAQSLESFGKSATMFVTAPLTAAGIAAVKFASDMEETTSKINVVFQKNASSVLDWSETTIEQYGLASQTALDMTATFGDMATSMGFTTNAAADMGTQLVARAADLASFKNIQIDVAKTALNGVFTGETESLKQLGVIMTQANLDLYAMEQGLGKTTSEMSQQEKVALRLAYVMDATSNATGDFARTSDSTANQLRKNKEQLKELGVTIGNDLLPMANKALTIVSNFTGALNDMSPAGRKTVITLGLVAAAAGPMSLATGKMITGALALATSLGLTNKELDDSTIKTLTNTATQKSQSAALFQAGLMATGKTAAVTALGISETAATPPTYALGVAVKFLTGPFGIVAGLLAAAIPLVSSFGKSSQEAAGGSDELATTTDDLNAAMAGIDMSAIESDMTDLTTSIDSTTDSMEELFSVDFNQFAENVMTGAEDAKEYLADLVMPDESLAEGSVFAILQRSALDFEEVTTQATQEALEVADQYRNESLQIATDKYNAEIALAYAEFNKNDITREQLDERINILNASYETEKQDTAGHYDEMLLLINQHTGDSVGAYQDVQAEQARIQGEMTEAEKQYNKDVGAISKERMLTVAEINKEEKQALKEAEEQEYKDSIGGLSFHNLEIERIENEYAEKRAIAKDKEDIATRERKDNFDAEMLVLQTENDKLMEEEAYKQGDAIVVAQEEGFRLYKESFDETFGMMPDEFEKLGENTVLGLVVGLESKVSDVEAAARSLAEAANEAYEKALDINSPSRVMMQAGKHTAEGIVVGMKSKIPDIANASEAMEQVASAGLKAVSNTTYNDNTRTTSQNVKQTINYTNRPMSQYEQIKTQKRMSRQLAASLGG